MRMAVAVVAAGHDVQGVAAAATAVLAGLAALAVGVLGAGRTRDERHRLGLGAGGLAGHERHAEHEKAGREAIIRGIQCRLTFQEPDAAERRCIFETLCPKEARLAPEVDFAAASRNFELTCGIIRNALLRAAYRACETRSPITQPILAGACRAACQAAGTLPRAARLARVMRSRASTRVSRTDLNG